VLVEAVGLTAMVGGGPPWIVYHISSLALGLVRRGTEDPTRVGFCVVGETALIEAVGFAAMFGGPEWIRFCLECHISSTALAE